VIQGGDTGIADFTLIPSRLAAPTQETTYFVSGQFAYTDPDTGSDVIIPLREESITVRPQAELELDYFLQRNVFSDDPFTDDVVEPSHPFQLGLMVNNVGAGDANNLSITSAQPKIIENEKGLLIDFEIIGSTVNGSDISPTLKVDFGDVAGGDIEVATWEMQSSLQGKFVDYQVSFEHINSLGIPELSLITETRIHELIQTIQVDTPGDDGLPDFLVNDDWETDPFGIPDTIYSTDGTILAVEQATGEGTLSLAAGPAIGIIEAIITADMKAGWSYAALSDPFNGDYRIRSVTRDSDGKELLLANVWQTDRTFAASGPPVYEDILHFVDHNAVEGVQTYTVVFEPTNLAPTAVDDAVVMDEDTSLAISVLANDTDPEG
ncbi:MAG: hypothetical protein ACPGVJ_11945, partial [Mangrovicoccus sp.]